MEFTDKVEVQNLDNKQRIVYSIENVISDEVDLNLEYPRKNCTENYTSRIANRDLYRMYKAMCEMKGVDQKIVYTGNSILEDWEDREDLEGETIEDFEPSL